MSSHPRRAFLGGLAALPILGPSLLAVACDSSRPRAAAFNPEFGRPLPIPPLAPSTIGPDGIRSFALRVQQGRTEILPGRATATYGYNGAILGPTLRASRGETVAVSVANGLPEATTTHWHGMRLPAREDGGPHQPIAPGASWLASWTIDQPAATLWYHPHPHGKTLSHVYRGLAGMFIVDDGANPEGLPVEYGVDDIPVILRDHKFAPDGSLDPTPFPSSNGLAGDSPGFVGDSVSANGLVGAHFEAVTRRVRLRVLNASPGRIYRLGFGDDREFAVVASDGGLLAEPVRLNRLQLSPAERAEILVDLEPGQPAMLRSFPLPDWPRKTEIGRFFGVTDSFDVLELRPSPTLRPAAPTPRALAEIPAANPPPNATTRSFEFQRGLDGEGKNTFLINGRTMDMSRVDFAVPAGAEEIWSVTGLDSVYPHNLHIHDAQFRVLDIAGKPPPPELAGWKDTVFVYPLSTVRVLVRFTGPTDPEHPYMYHCHMMFHEDRGMMGQFTVV